MRVVRSPPLRLLRVFCVAARRLSFKAAAEELHLTPSAVSHQVLDLEDQLEVRLFVRRTRALELTGAGHRLLEEVEPMLKRLDEAIGRVAKQGKRSTVRLALPPFFASELFIPQLTSLLDLRPDLDLRIETSDPRPAAHAATDDVSIVLTPEGMLNETGLRFSDEFVRHKILDIIGDLALLGMPILGKVKAERSGHIMHAGLMAKLLRVRSAWDIVDMPAMAQVTA